MKTFDETYADSDFKQHLDARSGWMAQVPRSRQPDLHVAGLRGSLFARILSILAGQRRKN